MVKITDTCEAEIKDDALEVFFIGQEMKKMIFKKDTTRALYEFLDNHYSEQEKNKKSVQEE